MFSIRKKRRKSIKTRWLIDIGTLIMGICIVNYITVILIYKDILDKKESTKVQIVTNAAISQVEYGVYGADALMKNLMKCDFMSNEHMSVKEKANKLRDYISPFYDIGVVDLEGYGATAEGATFQVKNKELFYNIINGEEGQFDLIEYDNKSFILFFRAIIDENGQKQGAAIGVIEAEEALRQVIKSSSGQMCFIADANGRVFVGANQDEDNKERALAIQNSIDAKELFKNELLVDKEYRIVIKDLYLNEMVDINYGVIGETGWVLGIVNNREDDKVSMMQVRASMLVGMGTVMLFALMIVYFTANSITKRILHIAGHVNRSVKSEFQESMPMELLQKEDELGEMAREMQKLEEEVASMLMSVKDSINYLNEKMEWIKVSEEYQELNKEKVL